MPKVAGLSLLFLLVAGCGERRGRPPIPSPDGSMTLLTRIEQGRDDPGSYLCVIFEICDSSGRVVHTENTRASDTMRWNLSWVSNDRIRLRSSDIGTYHWRRKADGSWVKEEAEKSSASGDAKPGAAADPDRRGACWSVNGFSGRAGPLGVRKRKET